MGTLIGHIVPALVLIAVGFWHLLSSFSSYAKAPANYSAKAWYPVGWLPSRLKHVELYIMVALIPLAIFYELGISTSFHPFVDGAIAGNRVTSFEHATVLIMFWLFALFVLLSETTAALPLPIEASFLFASLAFAVEWISIRHEAAQTLGLESQCNILLSYIACVCAVGAGALALRPKNFLVDVVLCMGLVLQGTWLIQIGLSLYVEAYIPQGCHYRLDLPSAIDGSTQCDIEEAKIRAIALMNLAFNCHVILVVLFSVLAFAVVAKLHGHRQQGYDPLVQESDPEFLQLKVLPKLSFDKR